ncbi:unnamed protein product [Xylocopa violacea]|uniref:alkaline phosphatase n=1 Tax=Xylocopa violacea TaxID=135666 RepID=A0ABP1PFZ1_XYLVO
MWRYLRYSIFGLTVVLLTIHGIVLVRAGEQEREVWYEAATSAIEARIRASAASSSVSGTTPPGGVARGVVLFVGDGMGMSTLTAARILSGQRHGNTGEEAQLAWDSFPAVALARSAFFSRRFASSFPSCSTYARLRHRAGSSLARARRMQIVEGNFPTREILAPSSGQLFQGTFAFLIRDLLII